MADENDSSPERVQTMEHQARALSDGEFEDRLIEAERAVAALRRQLHEAIAWRDALDAERDRRSIQRRAGTP